MIEIKRNGASDSRTCDYTKVTKQELLQASKDHINDVRRGMSFLSNIIKIRGSSHDYTKLKNIDWFYKNYQTGFKISDWHDSHRNIERHHLDNPKFIPTDVNLIDVLESIVDGIMAGLARKGEYTIEPIDSKLLIKAYYNTIKLVKDQVVIKK